MPADSGTGGRPAGVRPSEYGRRGVLGIGAPQANPTVEAELQLLRPDGVSLVAARLYSPAAEPRRRLEDYLERLGDTLARFGALRLDAFGFACTGSSYLAGAGREADIVAALEDRFGYPVVTAAVAIREALGALDARRILVVAPYPAWLSEPGLDYLAAAGFDVAGFAPVALPGADTHGIYTLTSAHALAAIRGASLDGVDAVLVSGTGLPSLRAIAEGGFSVPVVSSNLCLMWALERRLAGGAPDRPGADAERWRGRLDTL